MELINSLNFILAHRKYQTVSAASIDDPSAELNTYTGHEKGDLIVISQTAAGVDEYTLYVWDNADSGSENVPYTVDGGAGIWVAIAGRYINGDQTVGGVVTSNLFVSDPLIYLNDALAVGTAGAVDQGIIFNRGKTNSAGKQNVGFVWDESSDEFAFIQSAVEDGTTSGNVTIDSYAAVHAGIGAFESVDITPLTNVDALDISGTNMTTASAIDINMGAMVSGQLIDILLDTSTIQADADIIRIIDSRNHDDAATDAYRGVTVEMSGNWPGATASVTYLLNAEYSGIINNSAILYAVRGDLSGATLTGGTYAAGYFSDGTRIVNISDGTYALNIAGDVELATGNVLQWNNTDKLTHSANTMTVSGFTAWDNGAIATFSFSPTAGNQVTIKNNSIAGTNIAGTDILIQAGEGTGTGDVGQIIFKTPKIQGSGSSVQVASALMTLDESLVTIDGVLTVGALTSGDITITDTTPLLGFNDSDGDSDIHASIRMNLSDTGAGTEDADLIFMAKINGADTDIMSFDASGALMTIAGINTWDMGAVTTLDFDGAFSVTSNNGKQTFSSTAGQEFSTKIIPDANGGADIGTTALGWGDFYTADDKKHYFGSDQDFSMEYDENGNDHMIFSGADINMSGYSFVNEQGRADHVSNTMPSPYYYFDGVDDKILSANSVVGGYPFTLSSWFLTETSDFGVLIGLYDVSEVDVYLELILSSAGNIEIRARNTTNYVITSPNTYNDGLPHYAVGVFESATSRTLYVDGVNVGTDANSVSFPSGLDMLSIGVWGKTSPINFFEGQISKSQVWNKGFSLADVLYYYSGGSVPWKHQGASQTEQTSGTFTIGVEYRIKDWISNDDFTNVGGTNVDGNEFIATGTTPTTWTNSSIVIDIGVVAEYDGSSMTSSFWYNKNSAVSADLAVTGASLENKVSALTLAETLFITERASAGADFAGDGQFWVKDDSPNIPMFTDDAGTDFEISLVGTGHASMFWNANATVITPSTAAYPMACVNLTTGAFLTGITFVSSALTGTITDTADNGGVLRITDVAHGLVNGDTVVLHGMGDAAHNGVTNITKIDNDTFDCDEISYSSINDTGSWTEPDYLLISSDGAGEYHLKYNLSCTKGAGGSASVTWEPYKNAAIISEGIIQRQIPGVDQGVVMGQSFISVSSGDRIFLTVTNETNTNTLLHKYGSFLMCRL